MYNLVNAISINPPVKGEYFAGNSPLNYKTSHKTDFFGQTYAIDLLQTNTKHKMNPWFYLNFLYFPGLKSNFFQCWDKEIYSPFDGVVVDTQKNESDSLWNNIPLMPFYKFRYKQIVRKNVIQIKRLFPYFIKELPFPDIKTQYDFLNIFCGNYVIIKKENEEIYAFLGHMKYDSINVTIDENIKEGHVIGKIGNTGNSQAPHLHFHLCDSSDLWKAKGIPFLFNEYKVKQKGKYVTIKNSIPNIKEEILI